MFNKGESKKIREEFWTSFGKRYSRKWILYNTRIKDLQLKFSFDNEKSKVSLDVTNADEILRAYYFEKITSLKSVLKKDYLPEAIFEETFILSEGKIISTVYVELLRVNIHNKNDWPPVYEFLYRNMTLLETFFLEFEDYIKD